jgi:hypothetical protein
VASLPQTSDTNTQNDPSVDWSTAAGAGSCGGTLSSKKDNDPNDYSCLNIPALDVNGAVTFSKYYITGDESATVSHSCSYVDSQGNSSSVTVSGSATRPYYRNFHVVSATVNGAAIPSGNIGESNNGKLTETTVVKVEPLPKDAVVIATFAEDAKLTATINSCTAKKQGSNYIFASIVWDMSWK